MDRCDRCGARARYVAHLQVGGGQLAFCAHHYQDSKDGLEKVGAQVRDLDDHPIPAPG